METSFLYLKTFREEQITKYFSSLKSHPGVNMQRQKFAREHAKRFSKHFFVGTSLKHFEHFSKSKLE